MPTYEYLCKECGHNFEVVQSMKEDALVNCSECEHDSLKRVLYPAQIFSRQEAVTVAQQADRNTSNMGRYELESKRYEHAEAGKKAKEQAGIKPRPKAERPFWRQDDKINTNLAKLAPNVTIEKGKITKSESLSPKAMDYIMNGKV